MAITVTATASGTDSANGIALTVKVVTGAQPAASQPGATAGTATATTPQLAITPQASGSWVYGAVLSANVGTFTARTGTTFSLNVEDDTNFVVYGTFRSTSGTTTSSTTYGGTAPSGSANSIFLALAEILAAAGHTLAEDASSPAAVDSTTAKTVTTASFTPPAGSLLVAMVPADATGVGSDVTVTVSGEGLTFTRVASCPASPFGPIASVWVADVPGGSITSSGGVSMASMGAAGTGTATVTAAGGVSMASMSAAGTGTAEVTSSGGIALSSMSTAGTGGQQVTSSGGISLASMGLAGTASSARTLLVSIAAKAGTDDYGNSYPAGLQVTKGTISGSVFEGTNWLENAAGQFMYSGTPALGNILLSIAAQATTDPHGNSVPAGFAVYNSDGSRLAINLIGGNDAPAVAMETGLSFEDGGASIVTFPSGSGTTEFLVTRWQGPSSTLDDLSAAVLLSSNFASASGGTVQGQLIIGSSVIASWDADGFSVFEDLGVSGDITAANFSGSYAGSQAVSGWPLASGAGIGTANLSTGAVTIGTGFMNALNSIYNALVSAGLIDG